jgi:hypothetical protein|tara:strand:+ start:3260 stop:3466 length:207 start_codon:yes stop_codon:yes gene_type:complete
MQIKRLVNDKPLWDSFCEEVDTRITFAHKQIEQLGEPADLYRLQGEIKALRSLKQLRDKVNSSNSEVL